MECDFGNLRSNLNHGLQDYTDNNKGLSGCLFMEDNSAHSQPGFIVPYRTFVLVWVGLLILTVITVTASQVHLGQWGTVVAIVIASAKSSLVLLFFMGLKYERAVIRWMFLVAILSFMIFLALTYVDYVTR